MPKKPNPGPAFEEDFKRSIPPGFKLDRFASPSPGSRHLGMIHSIVGRAAAAGLLSPEEAKAAGAILEASRFTAKPPYDCLVTGPRLGGVPAQCWVPDGLGGQRNTANYPLIVFACELKSSALATRFDFNAIDDRQEAALLESEEAGRVSGLVVELAALGECWFFPIRSWLAYKATAPRKSMPIDDRRRVGIEIARQPPSPRRKRTYWDLAGFFARFGAEVEPVWHEDDEDGEEA